MKRLLAMIRNIIHPPVELDQETQERIEERQQRVEEVTDRANRVANNLNWQSELDKLGRRERGGGYPF